MILLLIAQGCSRVGALSLCFANHLKESDWDKTSGSGNQRIACFVPVWVVFSAQHMKEVAFVKGKLMGVLRFWLVVVKCFDDLQDGNELVIEKTTLRR